MEKLKMPLWGTLDPFYESGPVLGRKVANTQFLDHLLRADPFAAYHFFLPDGRSMEALRRTMQHRQPELLAADRIKILHRRDLPGCLAGGGYHCFHLSDCVNLPGPLAALRNRFSADIFPITSVTHSLSYPRFTKDFLAHLWPGTTVRDCIVATSRTGREVVENYFQILRHGLRLDASVFRAPRVERIPLGVDCKVLTPPDAPERHRLRDKAGLDASRRVVLVLGRISHQSKMDLLPLLRALQRLPAAGKDLKHVCLVIAGWTEEGDDYPQTLRHLSENMGLDLRLEIRPDDSRKRELLAMADLFVTIADNPQETFGLTVLEAGASGLPVVASDYDGYRDLVVHGETGLLVSTTGPSASEETSLMAPLLFENHVHMELAQQTVVDVPELANALEELLFNPRKAESMGRRAREHVCASFGWQRVISRYLELWARLRDAPVDGVARCTSHPLGFRFNEVFGAYTSDILGKDVRVRWSMVGRAVYRKQDHPLVYAGQDVLINQERVERLLFLARKACTVGRLTEELGRVCPDLRQDQVGRLILWALKQDLLEKAEPSA